MPSNRFTSDATCVGLYKFESTVTPGLETLNGLTTSPTNTNSMSFNPLGVKKEGNKSLLFSNRTTLGGFLWSSWTTLKDSNLIATFPGKNALVTSFTICCWIQIQSAMSDPFMGVLGKWDTVGAGRFVQLNISTGSRPYVNFGHTNGTLAQLLVATGAQCVKNQWYHIGLGYDNVGGNVKIRVWDDTGGSIMEKTFITAATGIIKGTTADLTIGTSQSAQANSWHGRVDELVFFNSFLSDASIDDIRMGQYLYLSPAGFGVDEYGRIGLRTTRKLYL